MTLAKPTPMLPAGPESSDALAPSNARLEPGATPSPSSTKGCEKGPAHAASHSAHATVAAIDRHVFIRSPSRCLAVRLPVSFVFFLLGDALDARELGAFVEVDEAHALGRAALLADLLDARADRDAPGGDEHDLVLVAHEHSAHELAVPVGRLDPDHPLTAAPVARVLGDRGALAEAVLGRRQHRLGLVTRDQHRHHFL